jgi:hypothetical protein
MDSHRYLNRVSLMCDLGALPHAGRKLSQTVGVDLPPEHSARAFRLCDILTSSGVPRTEGLGGVNWTACTVGCCTLRLPGAPALKFFYTSSSPSRQGGRRLCTRIQLQTFSLRIGGATNMLNSGRHTRRVLFWPSKLSLPKHLCSH